MEYFNLTQDNRYRHLPYIRNLRDILRREEDLYIEGVQLDKLLYFVGEELYSFSQDLLVSMLEELFPRIRQIQGLEQVERFWVGEFMGAWSVGKIRKLRETQE